MYENPPRWQSQQSVGPVGWIPVKNASGRSAPSRADLDAAADGDGLDVVFQPIVSLPDAGTVGFEALARWAHLGSTPSDYVFTHAANTGRAGSLERRCIEAAISGALDAGLAPGSALFINCEATAPYLSPSDSEVMARGVGRFQLVFEVTERSLLTHLSDMLRKVVALREAGFAIALDDVGTNMASLALLDVLAPDVIKLDLAVVQSQPRYLQARAWAAVLAHHERAGALVLAEGIETEEHLQRALALDATLGQGFRFGRPAPLGPDVTVHGPWPPIRTQRPCVDHGSPFDTLQHTSIIRRERKDTVRALSRYVELQALEAADPPMVLTALQRSEFFTRPTRALYRRLAEYCPMVVVFASDITDDLGGDMRGVRFSGEDPLRDQWIVVALGANTSSALVSREVPSEGGDADHDRVFDVAMTNDRNLVTKVARQLLTRMLTPPC